MAPLPPKPDFAAIEAAVSKSGGRRTVLLSLIGTLVYCWSNNESLLIYFLMLLMQTDETSAAVVFGTLNTTRARTDLVERLAKIKLQDPEIAEKLADVLDRFNESTRLRNEFNHCMYAIGPEGDITHTSHMRLQEKKGQLQLGVIRPMDDRRIEELKRAIADMTKLNRDMWEILGLLQTYFDAPERRKARQRA